MLAIKNGKLYTVTAGIIDEGTILIDDGKIVAIGIDVAIPEGAEVIDAAGKVVTPGIIDAHAHVGIWEEGMGNEGIDVNEATNPVTPQVRALDGINPEDMGLKDAYQMGVTAIWCPPGSANIIGGEGVTMRTKGESMDEMVMVELSGLKAAFGENPKGAYGNRKIMPSTRMGSAAVMREALLKTKHYLAKIEKAGDDASKLPDKDLGLEVIAKVLRKEIPMRVHAHRADDIMTAIRIAEEFDINITIEHGTEAHKVAGELAKRNIPVVIGPALCARSKVEVKDTSLATPAICHAAGVKFALMTDHPIIPVGYLPLAAAMAVKYGLPEDVALAAITQTAAEISGVGERVGSLEVGKEADVVVWTGHPFETETMVEATIMAGKVVYRRGEGSVACC